MIIQDDFYPPVTLRDMEYIFDIPYYKFLDMVYYKEIEVKKIGRKKYVSMKSLKKLLDSIRTDKKSIQRNIIKRKLTKLKENKILLMAKVIKVMRKLNAEFVGYLDIYSVNQQTIRKKIKKQSTQFEAVDLNLILHNMDDPKYLENLSTGLPYSTIKEVILEVRKMDLVVYSKKIEKRLKKLNYED